MQNSYDAIADAWHQQTPLFKAQADVDKILDRLEPGARVLDLGCGTGEPIASILSRGVSASSVSTRPKQC